MLGFAHILNDMREYERLRAAVKYGQTPVNINGVGESQKAHIAYSLCAHMARPGVFVTYNDAQANRIYDDMRFFVKKNAAIFPRRELIYYDVEAVGSDVLKQRIRTLDKMRTDPQNTFLILSIDALCSLTLPKSEYADSSVSLRPGDTHEIEPLLQKLVYMGYKREDVVEGRGQFSMRGGILDVYTHTAPKPFRIEFFDYEVDSIREFDPQSQLSVERLSCASITPVSEVMYDGETKAEIVAKLTALATKLSKKKDGAEAATHLRADIDKFLHSHYFACVDKYLPLIYPQSPTIAEYFSPEAVVFWDEPARISERAKTMNWELDENVKSMIEKGLMAHTGGEYVKNYFDALKQAQTHAFVGLSTLSHSCPDYRPKELLDIASKTMHSYNGNIDFLCDDLRSYKSRKFGVVILAGGRMRCENLVKTLSEREISASFCEILNDPPAKGEILVVEGGIDKGFEYPLINFVVISEAESQKRTRARKKGKKSKNSINSFSDLAVGDLVVHQNHGVGRYLGIERLLVEGATKDFLKIAYHGTDKLYIPTNQLDMLNKYIGAETQKLHKLSTMDWDRAKARVKSSCMDLARHLTSLYSQRQQLDGHKFSPDTPWQLEFEDRFPYEETQDQLRSIEEVKSDMQLTRPMDRLLCGDVGYGKTEVAMRAAFKCVMDSKQVAYLVPTTILAQQQYNNFTQRMKDYPIKVEMLSRFRSKKEQTEIIKKVKTGEVDIIIGTHRIIQKDLQFKSLGLLVVDEEQRFGVMHKERLKEIKKNVDVLTLTATPIPRTLHMAMVGIRDMSVLEEPPEDRYPVQTYVMEHNDAIIKDAIIREVSRGGQVFYLYNRVAGIERKAEVLSQMLPGFNVVCAHGKMNEIQLEDVMQDMQSGNIDVLVCTTIIETGLDIQNVNTIILEDSDRLGLSQMYQLRGRVGRSNRVAYAYLTYRKDKIVTEVSAKRLQAIKEFTEFGSGFRIAMRDLEIRGAGNLLGAQQHGHMDAVGYDMYCKLLESAVKEVQGEAAFEQNQCNINLNVDAYIPEKFITSHDGRIELYKRIAAIESEQDALDVIDEIVDRYGDTPQCVANLVQVALIKSMTATTDIKDITQVGDKVLFYFSGQKTDVEVVMRIITSCKLKILANNGKKPYLSVRVGEDAAEIFANVKIMLQCYNEALIN